MVHDVAVSADGRAITVFVPMQFRKRGGRKVVIAPATASWPSRTQASVKPQSSADDALIRMLAQAFHFQQLLNKGHYATVGDVAHAKKLDPSFVARILRLTLLAPDIVEAILDGRHDDCLQRQTLLRGMPLEWERQRTRVRS